MAYYFEDLEDFQLQIDYKFKNIQLLKDALTHSSSTLFGNSVKSKNFKNLGVVGSAVLKLITSEYAIRQNHEMEERTLSEHMEYVNDYERDYKRLAYELFGHDSKSSLNAVGVIRISEGILKDPNFGEIPYNKFLKAVFGAVFVDCGGSSGNGIKKCRHVFRTVLDFTSLETLPKLRNCFPVHESIREYWLKMGIDETHMRNVSLSLQFENPYLPCEAFIHESFYNHLEKQEDVTKIHKPDHQRLAFLGESVLELLIAEFILDKYPIGKRSIVEFVDSQLSSKSIRWRQIAEKNNLACFVKKDKHSGFDQFDKILEAFVGAAYIDCGVDDTKELVFNKWKLTELNAWKPEPTPNFVSEDERRLYRQKLIVALAVAYLAIRFLWKSKS